MLKTAFNVFAFAAAGYLALVTTVYFAQRSLLYFPSRESGTSFLEPWVADEEVIGFHRSTEQPIRVWLMLHGNGGQAAHRHYVQPLIGSNEALYVLEYPGYGQRDGRPSRKSIDNAAREAYLALRRQYPNTPVGLIGESLGSGPASALASESPPPEIVVLATPFDKLSSVAARHMPWLPARLLLRDDWDNVAALREYQGKVVILASARDLTVPPEHARLLADSLPQSIWVSLQGGHNDWSIDPAAARAVREALQE